MKRLSVADQIRIGLAPLHLLLGGVLCARFVRGARTPMVLVLGLLFVAYGVYRLALIRKALKS